MIASAVILAAGRGTRMQGDGNKVLLSLHGQAVITHCVRAFAEIKEISELILVIRSQDIGLVQQALSPLPNGIRLVEGGETRRDSSLAGVRASSGEVVLIHDGARPFPSLALIRRVLAATCQKGAAIPVLPVVDLLHSADAGALLQGRAVPGTLVRAQTPQGFRRDLILGSLEASPPDIRDDATAALLAGMTVATVPGDPANIKVTSPEDLMLAEAIAASLQLFRQS